MSSSAVQLLKVGSKLSTKLPGNQSKKGNTIIFKTDFAQ